MKLHKVNQRSSEWHLLRNGKITGTALKGIMGGDRAKKTAMYEVLAGRFAPNMLPLDENARDRGIRLEPEARAIFEKTYKKKVVDVGFIESDEIPGVGLSPDGLIKIGGKWKGAIEIKCPLPTHYVEYWHKNEVPRDYAFQVAQYFIVNPDLQTLYFVIYCPEVESHPMHVIKVSRKSVKDQITTYATAQKEILADIALIESELRSQF